MKIRCECGAIYNVPESTAGKDVQCKKCNTTFVCPTPPPKLNLDAAKRKAAAGKKDLPGTFAHSPYAKSKTASLPPSARQQQEEAVLKKYMSEEKSLEDRMRDRRESSIEEDRVSNGFRYIVIGCIWIAVAIAVGVLLFSILHFHFLPIVAWALIGLGAQYWLPPLLGVVGIYKIVIGVLCLCRVIDIESQEQLPSSW